MQGLTYYGHESPKTAKRKFYNYKLLLVTSMHAKKKKKKALLIFSVGRKKSEISFVILSGYHIIYGHPGQKKKRTNLKRIEKRGVSGIKASLFMMSFVQRLQKLKGKYNREVQFLGGKLNLPSHIYCKI